MMMPKNKEFNKINYISDVQKTNRLKYTKYCV